MIPFDKNRLLSLPCGSVQAFLLPEAALLELMPLLPQWCLSKNPPSIYREFLIEGFMEAVKQANEIAALAEKEGHHPELRVSYGKLEVILSTHSAGGITEKDLVLAAKIDALTEDL